MINLRVLALPENLIDAQMVYDFLESNSIPGSIQVDAGGEWQTVDSNGKDEKPKRKISKRKLPTFLSKEQAEELVKELTKRGFAWEERNAPKNKKHLNVVMKRYNVTRSTIQRIYEGKWSPALDKIKEK